MDYTCGVCGGRVFSEYGGAVTTASGVYHLGCVAEVRGLREGGLSAAAAIKLIRERAEERGGR